MSDCLIVVPTLGNRIEYLKQTLKSLDAQTHPVDVVMVVPASATEARELAATRGIRLIDDPGSLARAINAGMNSRTEQHEFVNWLGDDDLLTAHSVVEARRALRASPNAVLSFGNCQYIDPDGDELWINHTGHIAAWIMKWGPDLVPQPGMLIRANAWQQVGGVDDSYQFAFDLDLLLRLRKLGPFVYTDSVLSSFRWHPTSLTVSQRSMSIAESQRIQRAHASSAMRGLQIMLHPATRIATNLKVRQMNRSAKSKQSESVNSQ